MTGSVAGESQQPDNLKTTGKCDKSAPEKSEEPPAASSSPERSPQDETDSKTTLLPPIIVAAEPSEEAEASKETEKIGYLSASLPRPPGGPCKKKQLSHSSKSASSLPARPRMDVLPVFGTSSLARRGRAQSHLSLHNGGGWDPVFGMLAGDDRGFDDSLGARSELSAPMSASRRRRRGDRAYGTLERATSYSSLAAAPPRPTFRSANSTRPPPAPPCTTAHMEFGRHPVHPASTFSSAGSRLARAGTPRRNNSSHPAGPHFQSSSYGRDGKALDVWNPDEGAVANHLPQMYKHLERTNFTTGRTLHPLEHQSGSPDRGHGAAGSSAYQLSYRAPPGLMDYDHSLSASRLSSRPAAMGIVPNVMSPRCGERRVKLHVPRGQKLESLV